MKFTLSITLSYDACKGSWVKANPHVTLHVTAFGKDVTPDPGGVGEVSQQWKLRLLFDLFRVFPIFYDVFNVYGRKSLVTREKQGTVLRCVSLSYRWCYNFRALKFKPRQLPEGDSQRKFLFHPSSLVQSFFLYLNWLEENHFIASSVREENIILSSA